MYIINILLNNTDLLLDVFYIATIFCGISILIHRNAVISIIYFMLVYVNSSLYLYYTGYNGMPLLIILIYVGAIAILFLFILTLINVKEQEDSFIRNEGSYGLSIFRAGGLGNILILINILIMLYVYIYNNNVQYDLGSQIYTILDRILNIIFNINGNEISFINNDYSLYVNTPILDYPISTVSEIMILGQSMYTTYSLLLLILGLILVLSIIAAIAILKY